jgi:hypothetical protein
VSDEAKSAQLRERADLVFKRCILRPAAVQVVQVDLLDPEAPGAQVSGLPQVGSIADRVDQGRPRADRSAADEASFGRDDQMFGVGVERVADQQFVGVRSVDVSGVDQGHARFDRLPQKRDAAVTVGVFAPEVRAGEAHCAVADTADP